MHRITFQSNARYRGVTLDGEDRSGRIEGEGKGDHWASHDRALARARESTGTAWLDGPGGGDAIQAFVMGGLSPWVGFWLLRRFLRQAPRRRKPPPQSENAMLEPRRESQDIAELKADVSALKAEIRAGRSLHGMIKVVIVLCLRIARLRLLEPPSPRRG